MSDIKIAHYSEVKPSEVEMEGAMGVNIRWLIGDKDQPPNFQMRLFEVAPGGHSPFHDHPWEHEVFILEGSGKLKYRQQEHGFEAGYFILVPPGEKHSFINTGDDTLKFLCLIPNKKQEKIK